MREDFCRPELPFRGEGFTSSLGEVVNEGWLKHYLPPEYSSLLPSYLNRKNPETKNIWLDRKIVFRARDDQILPKLSKSSM